MSKLSDEELYAKLLTQANSAFTELYERHSGPLFRFVFRFTTNAEAAEEVLHDVFLELLAGRFGESGEGGLKSWLYTVAKNKSLNHLRKNSREVKSDALVELAASAHDGESESLTRNLLAKLGREEALLPLDLRETWRLRKAGHDHQEIARRLSIPVGTVKSRFSRLVEHLKKEFQNEN